MLMILSKNCLLKYIIMITFLTIILGLNVDRFILITIIYMYLYNVYNLIITIIAFQTNDHWPIILSKENNLQWKRGRVLN